MDQGVDLAVIGSGAAGFAAAIRATSLGRTVLMIERGTIGGTCVNVGCVPSKALLAAAEARQVAADSGRFPGIATSAALVDMPALIDSKQALVDTLRARKYLNLPDGDRWALRRGLASFDGHPDAPVLRVTADDGTSDVVEATHYLVATGGRPWIPRIEGLDRVDYLTSTTAMQLTDVPKSLLVLGGGSVALEQAQLFARLGAKVTMLVRSRLTSREEPEASRTLQSVLADEGVTVLRHAVIDAVSTCATTGGVAAVASVAGRRRELTAEKLLIATGRAANTEELNLDAVRVLSGDHGEIIVSDELVTSNPRIWAAGDVTGHPEFVYVAAAHGAIVADNAFSRAHRTTDYSHLPRVTFTSPALAAVGMTEEQAVAAGLRCDCRVLPLEHVPRAVVSRDTRGFVKVVADADNGKIIGISAVARDAGELAAAGVYLLAAGMTVEQVVTTWSPYLTMAEGIRLACQTYTTDVSKLPCCAV